MGLGPESGSVTHADIGQALGLLCCKRLLVLVTQRELGGGSGSDAATVRQEAHQHRGRILLLDWVKDSANHGDWFQPDGLHLTTAGAVAFTRLLARALPFAYPRPAKRRKKKQSADVQPTPPPGTTPPTPPLTIHTNLSRVGYVGATVTGPAGAQVALSEQLRFKTRPIGVLRLNSGTASVPRALTWSCQERERELVASTPPPAPPAQAVASVKTPSCSRRLAITIPSPERAGGRLTVRLADRWRTGVSVLKICVVPPGGRSHAVRGGFIPVSDAGRCDWRRHAPADGVSPSKRSTAKRRAGSCGPRIPEDASASSPRGTPRCRFSTTFSLRTSDPTAST